MEAEMTTLKFFRGDGQRRSKLMLFANTPFGTPTYTIENGTWRGPDFIVGFAASDEEAIIACNRDWEMRLRDALGNGSLAVKKESA